MAMPLICPRGHQWNSEEQSTGTKPVCPICGLAPIPATLTFPQTLDYQPTQHAPSSPAPAGAPSAPDETSSARPTLPAPAEETENPRTPILTQHISGYEILGELGRGGMGVVYKARQTKLNRLVALKMVLAGANADPQQLQRFRAEAEAVARLQHPFIVQIYEIGEHDGCPFFSLEFVDGGTLSQKLIGAPQPPRLAAQLVRLLALAIHSAHQKGIIHRDLKPSNILLATPTAHISDVDSLQAETQAAFRLYGIPKITDFGLAKHLDVQSQTRTGAILGTPSYMAPEQAEGRAHAIGPATDVYGLGTILYEMLTGRPPFESDTSLSTIRQLLAQDPMPPSQLHHKVPRDLETICLKCLEKDPARRYHSADDLAEDLHRFLSNRPIEARPLGWWGRSMKWMRRHPTKAAVICGLILAALTLLTVGGIYHMRLEHAVTESRQNLIRLHVVEGTSAMNAGDGFTALLWFTEALRLDTGTPEHEQGHRMRIAALEQSLPRPEQLWVHDESVNETRYSPDGRRVLTAGDDGKIYLWDSETGQEALPPLNAGSPIDFAIFSPDGRRVAAACHDGTVRLWDIGVALDVRKLPDALHKSAALTIGASSDIPCVLNPGGKLYWIDFSPDGSQLVTASGKTARVWHTATGKPVPGDLQHNAAVNVALFSPNGRWLATAGDDGLIHLWDAATRQASPVVFSHDRAVLCLAFSPDSKRIASGSADSTAQVWSIADGSPVGPRLRHRAHVLHVEFSPFGKRLLTSNEGGAAMIWRVADGEPLVEPMRHTSVIRWAIFSPDGCRVATAGDDNSARVWSASSGAPLTPPLRGNGSMNRVAFSPDGRYVAAASDDGTVRLWDVACLYQAKVVDEEQVFRQRVDRNLRMGFLTDALHVEPTSQISPDGRLVLKISKDSTARVYDAQSDKPITPPLAHHGEIISAAFSPDGRRVVTTSIDQTARVWDAANGAPLSPPLRHASTVWFADFNPDGRRLVTASDDNTARIWNIASGEMLVPPLKHDGTVVQARFSPDGQRVASGGLDQTARVWNAQTGQTLSPPLKHPWSVRQVRFSPDGDRLLTTGPTGLVWSWDLPTTDCATADLVRLAQLLSGSRIDEHKGIMPLTPNEQKELWITLRQRRNEFFHFSDDHIMDWHRQIAEECVRGERWSEALGHLDKLIGQQPDNWLYHARRGQVQGEMGHWKEASADFAEVVRRAPEEAEAWCLYAVLRLREGDRAGYRRACDALLKREESAKDAKDRIAYLTAWTCVLSPDSGVKGDQLVELAKKAVEHVPGDPDYLCTLGAALFRAGDLPSAAHRLDEARTIHGRRTCAREWLWLAMAHKRMGSAKEAREWLQKATTALAAPDAASLPWIQRLQLELLRREAEELVR
jgi:WD40 repeat protein/tetratricopeptide (TPR) repeat protein/tRNA A-37 threonylcarbamoyl transferase component Bud32